MGKSANQKLKILYIMKMLMEHTDEEHALTTAQIISNLSAQGIDAERKSIYADIESLRIFGLDIISSRSEPRGFYIASRDFEVAELKLLVDAVQSSKFITEKKSRALIGKIEKLAGHFEAKSLQKQVVVSNRIKTMNESIYYNVDKLHSAISANVKVRFQYNEWTIKKELVPKKNGAFYVVSPRIMLWDDENYYLIAFDDESRQIRHYRIDKMSKITLTNKQCEGMEHFKSFDVAAYSKRTFGMFSGEEKTLEICFDNKLIGVILDRFGSDVAVKAHSNSSFIARLNVNVSAQFYGWLAALGSGAKIINPADVAEAYAKYLKDIVSKYE